MKTMLIYAVAILEFTQGLLAQDAGITKSLQFTRTSNQSLSLPAGSIGLWNHRKFAVAVWFKQDSTGVHRFFVSQGIGVNTSPDWSFIFELSPGNWMEAYTLKPTGFNGKIRSLAKYTDTNKHCAMFIHDMDLPTVDQLQLWLDGSRLPTSVYQPPSEAAFNSLRSFYIGGGNNPAYAFNGKLCSVAMFSGTLPTYSQVFTADKKPKDLTGLPGRIFWERGDRTPLTTDEVLPTLWNNLNGVTQSTEIP